MQPLDLNEIGIGSEKFVFLDYLNQDEYIEFEREYNEQAKLLEVITRKYNEKVAERLSDVEQHDEISEFIKKVEISPDIFSLIEFSLLLYSCKLLNLSFFKYIEPLLVSKFIPANKGHLVNIIKSELKKLEKN